MYVSKAMWKDIMKRSSLENKVLEKEPKNLEEITRNKTKKLVGFLKTKERNFLATWMSVLQLAIDYFGKQLNHFLTKNNDSTNIKLNERDKILNDDEKIADRLCSFFSNIAVSNLNIEENPFI